MMTSYRRSEEFHLNPNCKINMRTSFSTNHFSSCKAIRMTKHKFMHGPFYKAGLRLGWETEHVYKKWQAEHQCRKKLFALLISHISRSIYLCNRHLLSNYSLWSAGKEPETRVSICNVTLRKSLMNNIIACQNWGMVQRTTLNIKTSSTKWHQLQLHGLC